MDVKILFQDDYLIVLDKPPNLVVDDSETHQGITLSQIMKNDFGISLPRGGIVHRLDKDTSGLIVVAKTEEVLMALQFQFKERTVIKQYLALVHGDFPEEKSVEGAIGRNPGDRTKFTVLQEGKESITRFERTKHFFLTDEKLDEIFPDFSKIQRRKLIQNSYQKYTLVRCFPKTGRTHQIRVHLKYIGFPILGDGVYCGRKMSRLDHRWCNRQFLHAFKLEFIHPIDKERLSFESPLPKDLEKTLSILDETNP